MYQFWRLKCSFVYKDSVKVKDRICFELAQTKEEAEKKTIEYLQSWEYTDISIDECRPETEDEKYRKEPVKLEAEEAPKLPSESVLGSSVSRVPEICDDELF